MAEDTDLRRFDSNEKISNDPSLRYHALEKKKILLEVLDLLQVDSKIMLGEFTYSDCQKVIELCLGMHAKVNVMYFYSLISLQVAEVTYFCRDEFPLVVHPA